MEGSAIECSQGRFYRIGSTRPVTLVRTQALTVELRALRRSKRWVREETGGVAFRKNPLKTGAGRYGEPR